mmetsp:Transcript_4200/g.14766  ORF Transcript_4200/g.14766 Transcript_4200/m.14766 type:complete len:239 (+) Transcript_4200:639-1355(+)
MILATGGPTGSSSASLLVERRFFFCGGASAAGSEPSRASSSSAPPAYSSLSRCARDSRSSGSSQFPNDLRMMSSPAVSSLACFSSVSVFSSPFFSLARSASFMCQAQSCQRRCHSDMLSVALSWSPEWCVSGSASNFVNHSSRNFSTAFFNPPTLTSMLQTRSTSATTRSHALVFPPLAFQGLTSDTDLSAHSKATGSLMLNARGASFAARAGSAPRVAAAATPCTTGAARGGMSVQV